jgi:hypothetical protein
MSNDNPTVEIDGTELEIRETEDGFEAVEVEQSEKPEHVSEQTWATARQFTNGDPVVHNTSTAITFLEDGDGDYWVDIEGEKLSRVVDGHKSCIGSTEMP